MNDLSEATSKVEEIKKELEDKKDECEEVRIAGEERILDVKN